jgi:hypothetical protein
MVRFLLKKLLKEAIMARSAKNKKFRFQRQATIGAISAGQDPFLEDCFVDKGDLTVIEDLHDHRHIIVGRTGTGKSALVETLGVVKPERVISIDPHDLSLSFIANDNVVRYFEDVGVPLAPFYRLLWKHVFVTEIIRKHYKIKTQIETENVLRRLGELVSRDKAKLQAMAYFREWSDKFWQTTEVRVKEMTRKVTSQLESSAGSSISVEALGVGGSATLSRTKGTEVSEEQKSEIIQRGKHVINDIQLSELTRVIQLLGENILDDPQKVYYITIDKLDEDWVEDAIRYHLIFELLTVALEFNNKLRGKVKVVIALREDLLRRVYDFMRTTKALQFQQEKYEDGYLTLKWNVPDLRDLLQKRVTYLYTKGYTNEQVTLDDVLIPDELLDKKTTKGRGKKYTSLDYILDRTTLTPRDVIRFFNKCIETARAQSTGAFTPTVIKNAEIEYSRDRLNALIDEWRINFPNLSHLCDLLRDQPSKFTISEVSVQMQTAIDSIFERLTVKECIIYKFMVQVYAKDGPSVEELLADLLYILFVAGVVGIERHRTAQINWSYKDHRISRADFRADDSTIHVHPGFYKILSINVKPD